MSRASPSSSPQTRPRYAGTPLSPPTAVGVGVGGPDNDAINKRVTEEEMTRLLLKGAYDGDLETVNDLLSKGVLPHSSDKHGYHAIHMAVLGHASTRQIITILKNLVTHGANVDAKGATHKGRHWTALHLACRSGRLAIVLALLELGANVNVTDKDGRTPLMEACLGNRVEIVEALLTKGARIEPTDKLGNRAMDYADSAVQGILKSYAQIVPESMLRKYNILRTSTLTDMGEDLMRQTKQSNSVKSSKDVIVNRGEGAMLNTGISASTSVHPSKDSLSTSKYRLKVQQQPSYSSPYQARFLSNGLLRRDLSFTPVLLRDEKTMSEFVDKDCFHDSFCERRIQRLTEKLRSLSVEPDEVDSLDENDVNVGSGATNDVTADAAFNQNDILNDIDNIDTVDKASDVDQCPAFVYMSADVIALDSVIDGDLSFRLATLASEGDFEGGLSEADLRLLFVLEGFSSSDISQIMSALIERKTRPTQFSVSDQSTQVNFLNNNKKSNTKS